ncbi:macro domain-containing protein [Kordiimonas lipolytica]|uniref:Macro domain-containing protein n=1 Tax=Kordiimonas lipolytica TaxID=1662421 RepID=A0ABV8UDX7_9PROT|nr:macro domain-containing protein [Kordiimonas lipolytica]
MKSFSKWLCFFRALLTAIGIIWLFIESYEGITNQELDLSYKDFLLSSTLLGLLLFFADGLFLEGFFKNEIVISSNSFDTKISVLFGDFFDQKGWKAIGVNDCFDDIVDDIIVSSKSLHGQVIQKFWGGNSGNWRNQVDTALSQTPFTTITRNPGRTRRYEIGTTATAIVNENKFLFVALGRTDETTHRTSATAEDLIKAVRGLLVKARNSCSNETIYIPLLGSGLARIGIKNAILVDLILTAVFEETKQGKVSNSIKIVLPKDKKPEIDLGSIYQDWK